VFVLVFAPVQIPDFCLLTSRCSVYGLFLLALFKGNPHPYQDMVSDLKRRSFQNDCNDESPPPSYEEVVADTAIVRGTDNQPISPFSDIWACKRALMEVPMLTAAQMTGALISISIPRS
jgi:hypothetical protein